MADDSIDPRSAQAAAVAARGGAVSTIATVSAQSQPHAKGHVGYLDALGAQVLSAREAWLDMNGPVRSLLIAVFGCVAQQGRLRIVERTRTGLDHAKAKGVRLGRPPARIDLDAAVRLRNNGMSLRDVARKLHVGSSTLHRALQAVPVSRV